MKKRELSLKKYMTFFIMGLTLVLVITYSILIYEYAHIGLTQASSRDLDLIARDFDRAYKLDNATPLPGDKRLKMFIGKETLPSYVNDQIRAEKYTHGDLMYGMVPGDVLGSPTGTRGLFLLLPYDLFDGNRLFVLKTYGPEDRIPHQFFNVRIMQKVAWAIGAAFIVIVVLVAGFLIRRLSRPIEKLDKWAVELTPDNINENHPDFGFTEINRMADLLQRTINQLNSALEREHRFLRNASHELRTPISVLRSNLDLLKKLNPDLDGAKQYPIDRIRRAVDNMSQLIETLLWINRSSDMPPEPELVDIGSLVKDLIESNRYLLRGKQVEIIEKIEPVHINVPATPAKIILGNLIRNAFQYTSDGEVLIRVKDKTFIVRNLDEDAETTNSEENDYGYGIGLDLVKHITEKLEWNYRIAPIQGGREVLLEFTAAMDVIDSDL